MAARQAPKALATLQTPRVVTPKDLELAGFDRHLAAREAAAGRWQQVAHAVYLPHADRPTEEDLVAAAAAHVGSRFVVTGSHPLHALGLRWIPRPRHLHVLVPPDNQARSSGLIRVTRTSRYEALATWRRYGVKYAEAARAVVDTGRGLSSLRDVRGVVLGAVADGWASPDELRALLAAGQRNGSGLTRRAVLDAHRGCASPPEAELVDELIGCRFPFYVNPELLLDGVLLGSTDVWLVGLGIGGEVESVERHETDDAQTDSTYDRHERITTPGLELVHLSVRRLRRDVREAAGHLLGRARARLDLPPDARQPRGLVVRPRGPLLR